MSLWGIFYKPQIYIFFIILIFLTLTTIYGNFISNFTLDKVYLPLKSVNTKVRLRGIYRIGPHNKEVLSVIFGSLLGDAQAERRPNGVGTRLCFSQEAVHVEYLLSLHKYFSELGYCNSKTPIITNRLGVKGKLRKVVRFSTWTYTSFNWIHDIWYENRIKRVPFCIGEYLTPIALAIWIMDDGSKVYKGLKLSTNSFTYNDCLILINVLKDNFNIKASIQSAGYENQYIIYIWKESMNNLRNIVSPYIVAEMKYKII